ncbi:response regulator [Paenibacillus antibioticophila]|uniref:response regulator n=1 Tax=Paenibacillus antibioticophila TaxID=1274374 RepID=UPI0005CB6AF3|nr:response regulator [Paenibacillus antibioticophila]
MYNILVVDDEPLICKGLAGLLTSSGLAINTIFTAGSGHEALDYIRMEVIDLLITDIQMGEMSGIELMHQAKIIKPWVQTIIISAHETFQYAQMALRLGARDYLIKPLNSEQFLDSVRNALLKMDKPVPAMTDFLERPAEHFHVEEPEDGKNEELTALLNGSPTNILMNRWGLTGPYFSLIKIKMDLSRRAEETAELLEKSRKDSGLFRYAALNVAKELLYQEWNAVVFYPADLEIGILLQWSEQEYAELDVNKISQLEMIGRSLHYHIEKYLGISAVIGISQILKGAEFLHILNRQVDKAISWGTGHEDYHVFYYGDFNWNNYAQDPSAEELTTQNNVIVAEAKRYIEENYNQKGLTIHEMAKKNHVSPNYLSYLFKKNTGYNLWEYVIKLRMEESKSLILHTDLRRYEIAERVGYESPEHFSKIFKKYFGVSPSDMKK